MRLHNAALIGISVLLYAPIGLMGSDLSSPSRDAMLGIWSSATMEKAAPPRPGCEIAGISERKVILRLVPGTNRIEGEWDRRTSVIWLNSDRGKCHLFPDETQFKEQYHATWMYSLSAEYDSDRNALKIKGSYMNCDGDECSRWKASAPTFVTEFMMVGRHLIDTNATPDPSDDIEFIRVTDEADEVADARTALDSYLKMYDSGDFGRFYDAASPIFRQGVSRDQFQARFKDLEKLNGSPTSRKNLYTVYALYAPAISPKMGEYVLFISGVDTSKKLYAREFMFLIKEGPQWKVAWFDSGGQ
jgi:hypothetical protein